MAYSEGVQTMICSWNDMKTSMTSLTLVLNFILTRNIKITQAVNETFTRPRGYVSYIAHIFTFIAPLNIPVCYTVQGHS